MKIHVILLLIILNVLQQNECFSKVSSNAIYEILTRGNSKTCYACDGDCSLPERINCASTSRCYSRTTRVGTNQTIGYKGCVEDENYDICDGSNAEDSCYVCLGSFCNREDVPREELAEDLGTNTCYYCEGECTRPTARHNCQEALTPIEGVVKAACFLYRITRGDTFEMYKGCLVDDHEIRMGCVYASLFVQGITCNFCRSDLCNGNQADEEIFPNECYYCDGSCEQEEVRNCKADLGQSTWAKCVAMEYLNEQNQPIVERKCAVVDAAFQTNCNLINQQGGNCTICDTDLCNGRQEEPVVSVDQCYFCNNTCDNLEVQNCNAAIGEEVTSQCISIDHVGEGGLPVIERRCIEVNQEAENTCDAINQQGGTCTLCSTNLCNTFSKEPENETYVEQCYYCQSVCERPLAIHQCEEVLGTGAQSKCIAKDYVEDDISYTVRGCTEVDDTVLSDCNAMNQQGGNCTICGTNLCNDIRSTGKAEGMYFSIMLLLLTVLTSRYA